MAGKGIYGGDTNLEARVDSLESGDAWDGKASGRVLTSGDPPTWAEALGGGGGGDLSAVDQDITVLNGHSLVLLNGTNPLFRASISNVFDRLTVVGSEDDESTTLRVADPLAPTDNYCDVRAEDGQTTLSLTQHNTGEDPGGGSLWCAAGRSNTLFTQDVEFTGASGPILVAPDASRHRLVVANDGTLSTEPVT